MPYVCVSDWGSNGDGVLLPVYPIESIRKGFLNRALPVCVGPFSGGNPGAIANELIKFGGQARVVDACSACKHGNVVLDGLSAATSVKAMVMMDFADEAPRKPTGGRKSAAGRKSASGRKRTAKRSAAPKKPARTKPLAKKSAAKKSAAKKSAAKRTPTAKKAVARKSSAKKSGPRRGGRR